MVILTRISPERLVWQILLTDLVCQCTIDLKKSMGATMSNSKIKAVVVASCFMVSFVNAPAHASYINLSNTVYRDSGQADGVIEMTRRIYNDDGRSLISFNGTDTIVNETLTSAELLAIGDHGLSYSYVDLSSGKIGGLVETVKPSCRGCDYSSAFANATFQENLVFKIAGASLDTITPVSFLINVHGRSTPTSGLGTDYSGGNAYISGQFGSGRFDANAVSSLFNSVTGFTGSAITGDGDIHSYSFTYNLKGNEVPLPFMLSLNLNSTNTAFSDYANTASVKFSLPKNVTFTSSSGIFLAGASAVPEPSSWAIMMLGFGTVGSVLRSRKKAGAAVRFA